MSLQDRINQTLDSILEQKGYSPNDATNGNTTGIKTVDHLLELKSNVEANAPQNLFDLKEHLQTLDLENGFVLELLSRLYEIPLRESFGGMVPSVDFVKKYPINLAQKFCLIGFATDNGVMPVAVGSIDGLQQLDVLRRHLKCEVDPFLVDPKHIRPVITDAYQQRGSQTEETIESLDRSRLLEELNATSEREDLLDNTTRSPVVRLVNSILFDAVKERASDVHIQPYEDRLQVRFRIDGVLFDQFQIPKDNQEEILSRVKVLAKMNIAEKRLPQDGRSTVQIADRLVDLRIASLPTSFGERIVIRLLDKSARLYSLQELGMTTHVLDQFKKMIHQEHGLILVTGPTGSGKSTTLYAALQEINSKKLNVVTLEDPIEYQLDGISQTQINEKKGLTFATGLRNILRQDPDIIMIGEIRDHETAEMAIQSALTGHLVFSTLHTNDAASAVNRLLDLGVESYLVASSLLGVIAQRLVRRICPSCKTPAEKTEKSKLNFPAETQSEPIYRGAGCADCRETGYFGRVGLFEQMIINESLRELVQHRANASEIRGQAVTDGMQLLSEDGIQKLLGGQTTIDEVIRVSAMQT